MTGLGPFVLADYRPGQRLAFGRNLRYWRLSQEREQLPRLDRLTLEPYMLWNVDTLVGAPPSYVQVRSVPNEWRVPTIRTLIAGRAPARGVAPRSHLLEMLPPRIWSSRVLRCRPHFTNREDMSPAAVSTS